MAPSSFASPLVAAAAIYQRDITGSFSNAKTTLSSWDNCMANQYCKWPVIVGIIIASLIVLSVVVCIGRCLCCGLECCCGCFACCNACCPSPRGSRRRSAPQKEYISGPQPGPWNQQQYQSQGPMGYGGGGYFGAASSGPQYAQFDASTAPKSPGPRITEDSLPAMPSWQTATTRHVEDPDFKEDDVELDKLQPPTPSPPLDSQHSLQHQQQQQQQPHRPTSDEARQPMLAASPYAEDYPAHSPLSPSSPAGGPRQNYPYADGENPYSHNYPRGQGQGPSQTYNQPYGQGQGQVTPYSASEYSAVAAGAGPGPGARSYHTTSPPPPSYASRAPTFQRAPYPPVRPSLPPAGSSFASEPRSPGYAAAGGNPYYAPVDAARQAPTPMPEAARWGGQRVSAHGQGMMGGRGAGEREDAGFVEGGHAEEGYPEEEYDAGGRGGGSGGAGLPSGLAIGQAQGQNQSHAQGGSVQRKPVSGSWRDI